MMPGNRRSRLGLGLERVGKGANSGERVGRSRDESGRGAFPLPTKKASLENGEAFFVLWAMGKIGRKGAETRRAQRILEG